MSYQSFVHTFSFKIFNIIFHKCFEVYVKVRLKSDQSGVDLSHFKMSMNPFDEIAVEEGVQLLEKGMALELIIVSIGFLESQDILKSALALGANRAILITSENFEPLNIAKILKKLLNTNSLV